MSNNNDKNDPITATIAQFIGLLESGKKKEINNEYQRLKTDSERLEFLSTREIEYKHLKPDQAALEFVQDLKKLLLENIENKKKMEIVEPFDAKDKPNTLTCFTLNSKGKYSYNFDMVILAAAIRKIDNQGQSAATNIMKMDILELSDKNWDTVKENLKKHNDPKRKPSLIEPTEKELRQILKINR